LARRQAKRGFKSRLPLLHPTAREWLIDLEPSGLNRSIDCPPLAISRPGPTMIDLTLSQNIFQRGKNHSGLI